MTGFLSTRVDSFERLDDATTERWMKFGAPGGDVLYPTLLGLRVEEVRRDYCLMRLPYRSELMQAAGFLHGGALASLLDHVMVPAVGAVLEQGQNFSTVDMHVQYMRAILSSAPEDAIAEGWVTRRGRRTVFCEAEAYGATTGDRLAKSVLTYSVSPPRP